MTDQPPASDPKNTKKPLDTPVIIGLAAIVVALVLAIAVNLGGSAPSSEVEGAAAEDTAEGSADAETAAVGLYG